MQYLNIFGPGACSLTLCRLGNFFCFLSSADFFQNQLFETLFQELPSECQTVWIQIRPDILSGLIWVETVCKTACIGYQQTTLGGKELRQYPIGSDKQIFNPLPHMLYLEHCIISINNSNFQIFSKKYLLHFNSIENIMENGTFSPQEQ